MQFKLATAAPRHAVASPAMGHWGTCVPRSNTRKDLDWLRTHWWNHGRQWSSAG